ncbi:NADH:flavin oxidoreductase [Alteraurantiacibacter buctensis]|uniref:12-oxophytodienoate reductase n=1 Tax=Alteraurantiacibacter buctensis TaxID=1503981 RepID=A0A844YUY7_9SPHN|nr:NADH:flavin oxidoreductase [Alteraurantiacibacter buctensis]MXO70304.1 12-oxophytodienoate reductase [Alteraurantiacibacter buctensis]
MASTDILFQPFTSPKLTLKNRIVMAPMTRNMAPGGVPGAANAAYYARRAAGEVGLILSEGTVVDRPASRNLPNIPFFHGQAALAGWGGVIEAVHATGGKMGPQIWHTGGTTADPSFERPALDTPSGLNKPDEVVGEPMSEEAIADSVAAFAKSALAARDLGFDTLELHGAHGYLIDQFFWPATNQRTDRWGGATIGERSRFAAEVVAAVREAVGPDFPILLRLSQWKQQDYAARLATTPAEMEAWLQPLADAGVDIFHASQRRFWEPEFPEVDGEQGLNFAGWAKKITGLPSISVGSVGLSSDFFSAFGGQSSAVSGLEPLIERMERGEFDLIAVGRVLLSDPQWAAKVKAGRIGELEEFNPSAMAELV